LAALRRGWRRATVDVGPSSCPDNVGPAVAGLWQPRIVLPEWALGLAEQERHLMLAHETSTCGAGPWLLAAAAAALVVLAPWNPVVWWQVRRRVWQSKWIAMLAYSSRTLTRPGTVNCAASSVSAAPDCRSAAPAGEPVFVSRARIRRIVTALPRWRWAGAMQPPGGGRCDHCLPARPAAGRRQPRVIR